MLSHFPIALSIAASGAQLSASGMPRMRARPAETA
jgi:hypothetical protein